MSGKRDEPPGRGVSRRTFLISVGSGVAAATTLTGVSPAAPAAPASEVEPGAGTVEVALDVNGRRVKTLVEPRATLLQVLRDSLGLTATKEGCARGECGSCTVLIDDRPRYACLTLALEARGHRVVTLEGLMKGEELGPVQEAFAQEDAFQCGFCTSGQVVAVEGLLRHNPSPTLEEIRTAVSGNLCRCGAYRNIFRAAERAARARRA